MGKVLPFKPRSRSTESEKDSDELHTETIKFEDGTYTGSTYRGQPHGFGAFTWEAGGGTYEGEWQDGMMHGRGVYTSADGNKTNVFYCDNEMQVDYENLPFDYIIPTYSLIVSLLSGEHAKVEITESDLQPNGENWKVTLKYILDPTSNDDELLAVFDTSYDEELNIHELLCASFNGLLFEGKEAKEWGELGERMLFLPDFDS